MERGSGGEVAWRGGGLAERMARLGNAPHHIATHRDAIMTAHINS